MFSRLWRELPLKSDAVLEDKGSFDFVRLRLTSLRMTVGRGFR